ncbi:MAG: methyl-accepting chemotaxis protein, partial [Loktanella sp.]|nr:methyl-accepting chemotaxis protein [Loktanella sp.]
RAGAAGRGFSVVAQEVSVVGDDVNRVADDIQSDLSRRLAGLTGMITQMEKHANGERLIDLAFTAVDTIDRNLYERTCDVRWWATDSAFVQAVATPSAERAQLASQRLGVILEAYNIYLDIWICGLDGRILANARPDKFNILGASMKEMPWFQAALSHKSGDQFETSDAMHMPLLNNQKVLTYACAIRENGDKHGRICGMMVTCFDWDAQAKSIVASARLDEKMRQKNTRVLLVDRRNKVIASSDGTGFLQETINIPDDQDQRVGFFTEGKILVAYHASEGFETYEGLHWKGVVTQEL